MGWWFNHQPDFVAVEFPVVETGFNVFWEVHQVNAKPLVAFEVVVGYLVILISLLRYLESQVERSQSVMNFIKFPKTTPPVN